MKQFSLLSIFFFIHCFALSAQEEKPKDDSAATTTSTTEALRDSAGVDLRLTILNEMQEERSKNSEELKQELKKLDTRIEELDKRLLQERNEKKRVESLVERVQILETKEKKTVESVLRTYQNNYASGVINLIFMEREIKPLILFNSSREFFANLNEVSNPMGYKGYQQWFAQFKSFIDNNKSKDANMAVLEQALSLTGGTVGSIPLAGPIGNMLISGISTFIGSLGRRDNQLREQSIQMMSLTTMLSQFVHDKNQIESEWDKMNKELENLQKLQDESMQECFETLGINPKEFDRRFTKELDHSKLQLYVAELRRKINDKVAQEQRENTQSWKADFHRQMQKIQALKLRFGQLTFSMLENIFKYKELIEKYEKVDNADIKLKMRSLETSLTRLHSVFDQVFQPQKYIEAASTMYVAE